MDEYEKFEIKLLEFYLAVLRNDVFENVCWGVVQQWFERGKVDALLENIFQCLFALCLQILAALIRNVRLKQSKNKPIILSELFRIFSKLRVCGNVFLTSVIH